MVEEGTGRQLGHRPCLWVGVGKGLREIWGVRCLVCLDLGYPVTLSPAVRALIPHSSSRNSQLGAGRKRCRAAGRDRYRAHSVLSHACQPQSLAPQN